MANKELREIIERGLYEYDEAHSAGEASRPHMAGRMAEEVEKWVAKVVDENVKMAHGHAVSTTHHVNDRPDSIEIGTPAKGGAIKVYGDSASPDAFRERIDEMVKLREYAQRKTGITG